MPRSVVCDRGTQHTSKFWKRLCYILVLQISVDLSTSNHPESDGQTERLNQILEQFFRCFVDDQQGNWSDLLPLAEFAYNNTVHSSIKMTPFFANYGFHPCFDPLPIRKSQVPAAEDLAEKLSAILSDLKDNIGRAQEAYKHFADQQRLQPPKFKEGQRVWLLRRNIKT